VATKRKNKDEGDLSIPDVIEGVTLSRTLPPFLPANFLARRHLVEKIDVSAPGTTLIVAPIGYGKTSLATEIAQHYPDRTFWYTMVEDDSPLKFNAYIIQAVRNVIPDFAPWFESEKNLNPMELILRFSNDLAARNGEYIFIIDNRRTSAAVDFATANQVMQSLPRNLHLIHIRRHAPDVSAEELAPMGNLQIIGPSDLRFTTSEVESIAAISGLSPLSAEIKGILDSAQGWPAAVQLITRGLSKGESFQSSASEISAAIEPLRVIVEAVVRGLSDEERRLLAPLSAVSSFTSELAQLILGKDFSQHRIDALALEGALLSKATTDIASYKIHTLIKEILYKELGKNEVRLLEVHQIASEYFEDNLEPTDALEHAFLSQDFQRFENLFRIGARNYAATGRGDALLRWAKYAGDDSVEGQLKRQTVEIAGHLANLDLEKVGSINAAMRLQSKGTDLAVFMERYSALIEISLDSAFARFESLQRNVTLATAHDELADDSEFTDTLFALRRLAGFYFLTDQVDELEELDNQARELLDKSFSRIGHIHQLAIRALSAYQMGYIQDAFESSKTCLSLSEDFGMKSSHSPNDAQFIYAACNYEFTEIDTALINFHSAFESAESSQQWSWYCATASFVAAHKAEFGNVSEGLDFLRIAREKVASLHFKNDLSPILDRGEMTVRVISGEMDRVERLIKTALPGRAVDSLKLHFLISDEKTETSSIASELPDRTPRQAIFKSLVSALYSQSSDEDVAMDHLTDALRVGAEVGAKGIFITQIQLYPLLHKVAVKVPTFYHEDISRKAALRMQEINASKNIKPELTKREIEIVGHLDSGKPITAIGASLHISHNTMKTHLKNVYRKLGADGRDQAVEKAKSLGLI
jgi:ATP/maltotriose-dependent transcriptional regulator MalT